MICPKCGFEQPDSPECARCGVVISRYKGPTLGAAPVPPGPPAGYNPAPPRTGGPPPPPPGYGAPPPPPPSFGNETIRMDAFPPPVPAMAGGGTIYGGPPPAAAGTVYGGPAPGTMASGTMAPTFGSRPAFRGTFEVGKILGEAFSIYFNNFLPFLVLTSVAFAPVLVLGLFLTQSVATDSGALVGGAALIGVMSLVLCVPLSTGAITYGVFQQMRGGETSLGACLRVGLSSMLPVLGVACVLILLIFGVIIVTAIPVSIVVGLAGAAAVKGGGNPEAGLGCTLLLMPLILLCYVPAIYIYLKYFVAVPVAVEERPGIINALRRSAFLTEGRRWPILGVLFLLGLINIGLGLVITLMPVVGTLIGMVFNLVMTGVFSTACAVVYYRLRSLKESIDVDQISSVFA